MEEKIKARKEIGSVSDKTWAVAIAMQSPHTLMNSLLSMRSRNKSRKFLTKVIEVIMRQNWEYF